MHRISGRGRRIGVALVTFPLSLVWLGLVYVAVRSFSPLPGTREERREVALRHLRGLRRAVRVEHAAWRMQQLFPEGGCFTITLYGLSWANVMAAAGTADAVRRTAAEEVTWALDQYDEPYVVGPFKRTQVDHGVFWLGQRNLLLGRFLKALPASARPAVLVEEYHANSAALATAFLRSPTAHLDSYPGFCWPADNVTALASLIIHDELYSSGHAEAFERWKRWTLGNPDPTTGLPAGQIDSASGSLLQPSRGCASSWILGLLPRMDAELASDFYARYRRHFLVDRLGYHVFSEYARGVEGPADVDSGPILWGVGVTATGAGLAAALANGDWRTAEDIRGLSAALGWRRSLKTPEGRGTHYLSGRLPVGDAFLTWGYSLADAQRTVTRGRTLGRRLWDRRGALGLVGLWSLLLIASPYLAFRRRRRRDAPREQRRVPGSNG